MCSKRASSWVQRAIIAPLCSRNVLLAVRVGLPLSVTVELGLHPAVPQLSLALGRDLGHDKQRLLPVQRSRLRQSASRTAAGTFPRASWVAPLAPRLEVRGHLPSSPATLAALPVEAQLQ